MKTTETRIQELVTDWITNQDGTASSALYTVVKLQGSYQIEHSVARIGANTLWSKLNSQDFVAGLGALEIKPFK
jgi:isocitrate lyase